MSAWRSCFRCIGSAMKVYSCGMCNSSNRHLWFKDSSLAWPKYFGTELQSETLPTLFCLFCSPFPWVLDLHHGLKNLPAFSCSLSFIVQTFPCWTSCKSTLVIVSTFLEDPNEYRWSKSDPRKQRVRRGFGIGPLTAQRTKRASSQVWWGSPIVPDARWQPSCWRCHLRWPRKTYQWRRHHCHGNGLEI